MKSTPSTVTPVLIGGKFTQARSGETLEAINPATGEVIGLVPACDAADVDDAVTAAAEAAPAWAAMPAAERGELLYEFARQIEENADELAGLDVRDNGSPIREMAKDAATAAAQVRFFAGQALMLRGETIPTTAGRVNYTLRQPWGVVGRIIPFNHPFMFAATKVAAPLVAGNTVVLKPSEFTSLSALRLAEIFADIFPAGVVNVVTGLGATAGDAIVRHPAVRRLAFIGSEATGRIIQGRAAEIAVKDVTLELGGKNALVVFPDADLEAAVDGAVRGMNFTWQGQSCGSTSRLLVHRDIHDRLVAELAQRVDAMRSGMPDDPNTETGAIVNRLQYDKVLRYIEIGSSDGGRLEAGGGPAEGPGLDKGLFVRPTVFSGVDPSSRLAMEEVFGPVLAVMPFDSYEHAISIANRVEYGLTASVFTRDLALAHSFARDVEAGYVWVNDSSKHFLGTAFGGWKNSGVGREEGLEELESYSQIKNVNVRFADD